VVKLSILWQTGLHRGPNRHHIIFEYLKNKTDFSIFAGTELWRYLTPALMRLSATPPKNVTALSLHWYLARSSCRSMLAYTRLFCEFLEKPSQTVPYQLKLQYCLTSQLLYSCMRNLCRNSKQKSCSNSLQWFFPLVICFLFCIWFIINIFLFACLPHTGE